jgi:hypothetical protein
VWAARALVHFLLHLAIAVLLGVLVSGIWALAHGGSFRHSLVRGFLVIGALTILVGGAGQSNLETAGRIPGMPAWTQSQPGDTSIQAGALLILAGLVLIGLGIVLSG